MKHPWFKERTYLHFDPPVSINQLSHIEKIVSDSKQIQKHSFYPLITFEVTKYKIKEDPADEIRKLDTSKTREITYCAHLDSHILSYYSHLLQRDYEIELKKRGIDDSVLAFRRLTTSAGDSKSNIHFASEAFDELAKMKNGTAYAFDLKSYFDTIDHSLLKERWATLINKPRLPDDHFKIFNFITKRAVVDRASLIKEFKIPKTNALNKMKDRRICSPKDFRTRVREKNLIKEVSNGIAQGSPISAMLSNLFLIDFDQKINNQLAPAGCVYFRYCDDILILAPENIGIDIKKLVEDEVTANKLKINDGKTEIIKFYTKSNKLTLEKPLQYLGFMFDGQSKYIRSGSISQHLRKARLAIKSHKTEMAKKNEIRKKQGINEKPIYKRSLFKSYSHFGKKNFISYGLRASEIMKSRKIRKQMLKLNRLLLEEINN